MGKHDKGGFSLAHLDQLLASHDATTTLGWQPDLRA